MLNTINLFISHSWSYGDAYTRLYSLLNNRPYFAFKNYSVPKDDPIHNAPTSRALYEAIKRQMAPCHVIIIMAGKYATYSQWIQNEIKIAKSEFATPKPIVAVTPWGAQQISTVVRDSANLIAKWNTDSIVQCIRDVI